MPLMIGAAIIGGLGSAYGAYQSVQSAKDMKGYDMGAVRNELKPWQQDIDAMRGRGEEAYQQSQQYFDPRSSYYDQQRQQMREQISSQTANVTSQQNQLMAQRGMGSGGMRGLLGAVSANQAGEQTRQGMVGLQNQGIGLGLQMQGQAGSMLNAAMSGQQGVSENMAQTYISNIEQQNAMKAQEANAWAAFGGSMGQFGSAGLTGG